MPELQSRFGALVRPAIILLWLYALTFSISGCTNTGANEPASEPVSQPRTARPRGSG